MPNHKIKVIENIDDLVADLVEAFDDLTIVMRLRFATNFLCDRGGEKDNRGSDPALVTVVEILRGVIEVLESYPKAGAISEPAPPRARRIVNVKPTA